MCLFFKPCTCNQQSVSSDQRKYLKAYCSRDHKFIKKNKAGHNFVNTNQLGLYSDLYSLSFNRNLFKASKYKQGLVTGASDISSRRGEFWHTFIDLLCYLPSVICSVNSQYGFLKKNEHFGQRSMNLFFLHQIQ